MYYHLECIIKNRTHIPIACGLYIESDHPDILEDKYESYVGDEVVDLFASRMSYCNKLFKEIFSIIIPIKEDSIIPLTIFFYCNEYTVNDIVMIMIT